MKPIRHVQRFRCDYCKYTTTKSAMEKHEKRCWNNPKRYCDACDNTGNITEGMGEMGLQIIGDCPYCEKVEQIKEREKEDQKVVEDTIDIKEVPF
jgi:hypothetical protein